jgi:hypothetical protein
MYESKRPRHETMSPMNTFDLETLVANRQWQNTHGASPHRRKSGTQLKPENSVKAMAAAVAKGGIVGVQK